jgi:membrane-associated phospholipid phosphatase
MKRLFTVIVLCASCISVLSQNTDISLLKSINKGRNKGLDGTFIFITNSVTPTSIAMPVVVLTAGFIRHDSTVKNKGLCIAASLIFAAGISTGLKYSIDRTRPFVTYPFIEKATSGGSPSFPSGHTSDAFATATSLSLAFPKWYVIVPSYLWAGSVGYSRMHLGVHYPSDVLGGAVVGAGSAFLCYKANQWLGKRKTK